MAWAEGFVTVAQASSIPPSRCFTSVNKEDVTSLRLDRLWKECSWNTTAATELLHQIRVDPDRSEGFEQKALYLAIDDERAAFAQVLLKSGKVNPNAADELGCLPLQIAATARKDGIVKILLDDERVDPNSTDEVGRTPLHWAVYCGAISTVELLLHDNRVDANREDNDGHAPFFYALDNRDFMEIGRAPIIKILLSIAAENIEFPGTQLGNRLLRRAIQQHDKEVVELLLDDGRVDPNSRDVFGLTPLAWAKAGWDPSMVDVLLNSSGVEEVTWPHPRLDIACRCLDFWMRACNGQHAGGCCAEPVEKRLPHQIPDWIIDVSCACIIPGRQVSRYAALSYVWDPEGNNKRTPTKSNHPKRDQLLLTRDNLCDFRMPGYFQGSTADRIPVVVHDAMALVGGIGVRYLWVDCLCIVQDDEKTRQQIDHMHEIYLGASLTIIAATRDGLFDVYKSIWRTSHFLDPGWRNWGVRRCVEELYRPLHTSTWSTRGWTFQEEIMSKRAVIFLDGNMFWNCQNAVWDQDYLFPHTSFDKDLALHNGKADRMLKIKWPDFRTYIDFVASYNDRNFSYPQDALAAISGILSALSNSFSLGFVSGLPRLFFDDVLLWQPFNQASRRVAREGGSAAIKGQLPSWSWCGWQCLVDPMSLRTGLAYLNDEESRNRTGSWHTSRLVQWYAISEDMQHEIPIAEPQIMSDYETPTANLGVALPHGWSLHAHGPTVSGDKGAGLLYVHESDINEIFRRPVPIAKTFLCETKIQSKWPLLSGITTRAFLRIASLLKPYDYRDPAIACVYKSPLFETPHTTYAAGPAMDDIPHVISLQDAQGSPAGLLRRMDDKEVIPGEEIELVAISAGSVDKEDLDLAFENSVDRKQLFKYPSGPSFPFWRILPGDGNSPIEHQKWAPDYQKDTRPVSTEDGLNGKFHFYNVLWIERKGDIAYRRAAGRVPKDVWDKNCSEPGKIILG